MKKLIFLFLVLILIYSAKAQNCEKGCGKITKVEPTTIKGLKPNRALLVFKFQGPDGKPAKNTMKVIVDSKDTINPKIDKLGTAKITAKPGNHKLKFMAKYWYSVKMDQVSLKADNTYYFLIRYEAKEIGPSKSKDAD